MVQLEIFISVLLQWALTMKKYDVIVIGSGGGTKISTPAAILGYKAAIIEEGMLGGTCLNRGCIPSKMLIHPANIITLSREAKKLGVDVKNITSNFAKIVRRVSKTVDDESRSIGASYKNARNLDYYHGHAKFVSNKAIEVNGKNITAKKIFIATGARSSIPPIAGLGGTPYMTSTEALRNTKLPKNLIVIGGGYIACELGHAYAAYGSRVQFVVRKERFLMREDEDVSEAFTKAFRKLHKAHIGWTPTKVQYSSKKFTVILKNKNRTKKINGDGLLMATGIIPNSDNLGLQNTKIKVRNGFIKISKYMETNVPGVYAIGDVAGNYMFRHSVNFEGEFLFRTLFVEKRKKPIKYPPMPYAVFTHPEIAGVGPSEEEIMAKGIEYIVGNNPYKSSAQGMARMSEDQFVKLIFNKKTGRLISARIIGEEAATMIHQLIYAMTYNGTVDDLLNIIYIHPALPEIVRNAARKAKAQFDS
jgi:mycothione reductase